MKAGDEVVYEGNLYRIKRETRPDFVVIVPCSGYDAPLAVSVTALETPENYQREQERLAGEKWGVVR